jgi:hypothetical protein
MFAHIHLWQCGHRFGGIRAMSATMAATVGFTKSNTTAFRIIAQRDNRRQAQSPP